MVCVSTGERMTRCGIYHPPAAPAALRRWSRPCLFFTKDQGPRTGDDQDMATQYEMGMVGLGVMGRSLVLNLADHGFAVAGYDRNQAQGQALVQEGAGKPV